MSRRRLTPKQARFVEEYLVDLNAVQAALRAGYSARTVDKQGWQILGRTRVAEEIAKRQAERARKVGITQEEIIEELRVLAFAESSLSGELSAKVKALQLLGQHLGMFPKRMKIDGRLDTGGVLVVQNAAASVEMWEAEATKVQRVNGKANGNGRP